MGGGPSGWRPSRALRSVRHAFQNRKRGVHPPATSSLLSSTGSSPLAPPSHGRFSPEVADRQVGDQVSGVGDDGRARQLS